LVVTTYELLVILLGVFLGVNPTVVAGGEGYFCNASSTTPLVGCTHDRRSKAYCNFQDYDNPLPIEHQV
jgi:hypothetical protein